MALVVSTWTILSAEDASLMLVQQIRLCLREGLPALQTPLLTKLGARVTKETLLVCHADMITTHKRDRRVADRNKLDTPQKKQPNSSQRLLPEANPTKLQQCRWLVACLVLENTFEILPRTRPTTPNALKNQPQRRIEPPSTFQAWPHSCSNSMCISLACIRLARKKKASCCWRSGRTRFLLTTR